jgi:hypothetical protein
MKPPLRGRGWRGVFLLTFFACLNPQPDEHPLLFGNEGPSAGQGGGAPTSVAAETPVFSNDPDQQGASPNPNASSPDPAPGAADAGPPPLDSDAGPADAGVLVQ